MGITVQHDYFTSPAEAKREIEADGLICVEYENPPSEGTPIHWHDVRIHAYILDGVFHFEDPGTGEVYECGAGTKFVIPPRTLHIEDKHNGYTAIIGLSESPVPEPFVRSPEELEL